MVNGNKVGHFVRSKQTVLLPDGRVGIQLTMASANAKNAPRFLKGVEVPLTKYGTPIATYMNLRAFHRLDIPFGSPSLKRVKMHFVMNANTSIQLEWMKRVYGAENIGDFLKHTHSVRYAESALNQAGFKVKSVELGPRAGEGAAGKLANTEYFNAPEGAERFLKRHGIDPDDEIEFGHDILIYVEPM